MKKFFTLLMTISMMSPLYADAAVGNVFGKRAKDARHHSKVTDTLHPATAIKSRMAAAPSDIKFKAGKETVYAWDGDVWVLDGMYSMKFDGKGQVVEEVIENYDGTFNRTLFTYDADGMVTLRVVQSSYDGENFDNYSKTEREYDPIVKNLIVKNREYYWDGSEWVLSGNNYDRNVTRNDAGNVTQVEIAVLFQGVFDPTNRLYVTYNAEGKACTIRESVLNYDGREFYWEDDATVDNIVWDRTDGQIVDLENLGSGENRVKSADIIYDEEDYTHVEFTFDGNNFTAAMSGIEDGEKVEGTSAYEELDDYGSFRQITSYTYASDALDTYTETETITERYDAYGNLLESKDVVEYGGYEEVYEDMHGTVDYDSEKGYPLTYVLSAAFYDYDLEENVTANVMKVDYSDYVEITSRVAEMEVASGDAEYFNLRGVKVTDPVPGSICIRKRGGKTDKVIIR